MSRVKTWPSDFLNEIANIIDTTGKTNGNIIFQQFAQGLLTFTGILEHAKERDWVAIGFDISDQLRDYKVKNEGFQNGLRFSRTLLTMYQAESVEEAKGIFQATLENEASRERRYNQTAYDITALNWRTP